MQHHVELPVDPQWLVEISVRQLSTPSPKYSWSQCPSSHYHLTRLVMVLIYGLKGPVQALRYSGLVVYFVHVAMPTTVLGTW